MTQFKNKIKKDGTNIYIILSTRTLACSGIAEENAPLTATFNPRSNPGRIPSDSLLPPINLKKKNNICQRFKINF